MSVIIFQPSCRHSTVRDSTLSNSKTLTHQMMSTTHNGLIDLPTSRPNNIGDTPSQELNKLPKYQIQNGQGGNQPTDLILVQSTNISETWIAAPIVRFVRSPKQRGRSRRSLPCSPNVERLFKLQNMRAACELILWDAKVKSQASTCTVSPAVWSTSCPINPMYSLVSMNQKILGNGLWQYWRDTVSEVSTSCQWNQAVARYARCRKPQDLMREACAI